MPSESAMKIAALLWLPSARGQLRDIRSRAIHDESFKSMLFGSEVAKIEVNVAKSTFLDEKVSQNSDP